MSTGGLTSHTIQGWVLPVNVHRRTHLSHHTGMGTSGICPLEDTPLTLYRDGYLRYTVCPLEDTPLTLYKNGYLQYMSTRGHTSYTIQGWVPPVNVHWRTHLSHYTGMGTSGICPREDTPLTLYRDGYLRYMSTGGHTSHIIQR
jgi:hypothetical protein